MDRKLSVNDRFSSGELWSGLNCTDRALLGSLNAARISPI